MYYVYIYKNYILCIYIYCLYIYICIYYIEVRELLSLEQGLLVMAEREFVVVNQHVRVPYHAKDVAGLPCDMGKFEGSLHSAFVVALSSK